MERENRDAERGATSATASVCVRGPPAAHARLRPQCRAFCDCQTQCPGCQNVGTLATKPVPSKHRAPSTSLTQEKAYITQVTPTKYVIAPGFVPGMRVPGAFYVDESLAALVFEELADSVSRGGGGGGGFLPAVKQVANVAALPGIVGVSLSKRGRERGWGFRVFRFPPFFPPCPHHPPTPSSPDVHGHARPALRLRLRHRQRGRL